MSTLLDVKDLSISFGGLHAVDDFNISIKKGQLYGLIGPVSYTHLTLPTT